MSYDLVVVGAGASGVIASIVASRGGKKVLLLEKLPQIATKLKATGGGRCNLSNTLSPKEFIESFGKSGYFMFEAINMFTYKDLISFFDSLGVDTHIPDGFRIFPTSHKSITIIEAMKKELKRLKIDILCSTSLLDIKIQNTKIVSAITTKGEFTTSNILLCTGGLGYPKLGASGDGHTIAKKLGHTITKLYPAMMPLFTKEKWQKNCKADTISKVMIKVDLPNQKFKKLKAQGDLIFTSDGLRGPVILDFAREITPYLKQYKQIPILVNLTHNMGENDIINHIKKYNTNNTTILDILKIILPKSVAIELCKLANIDINQTYKNIDGKKKQNLIKLLVWTPFTIVGHSGFDNAMITRGGVSLKEIDSKTMGSKLIKGLYFAGEIVDIDGPCGGYNLQWAFSSGYVVGKIFVH